jgi:hypothetical protein
MLSRVRKRGLLSRGLEPEVISLEMPEASE